MLLISHESVRAIENWAVEMGLHKGVPLKQYLKIRGEYGELIEEVLKGRPENAKKEIGDVVVTLVVYRLQTDSVFDYSGLPGFHHFDQFDALHMLEKAIFTGDDVTSIMLLGRIADCIGFTLQECVDAAVHKITNRKATMIDGTLVKESDR